MCVNPSAEGGKRPRARFPGDQWPPKEVEAVICLVIRSIVPFTGGEKKRRDDAPQPGTSHYTFFLPSSNCRPFRQTREKLSQGNGNHKYIYISDNILDDIIYQHTFCVCCLVKGYIWGGHSVTYIQATIWDSWMDPGSRRSFVCAIHLFGFHHRPLSLLFGVSPFSSSSTPPDIIWHSFFPSVSRAAAAADLDVYNPRLNSIWRVRDGISWLSFFSPSLLSFHLRAHHDS